MRFPIASLEGRVKEGARELSDPKTVENFGAYLQLLRSSIYMQLKFSIKLTAS